MSHFLLSMGVRRHHSTVALLIFLMVNFKEQNFSILMKFSFFMFILGFQISYFLLVVKNPPASAGD